MGRHLNLFFTLVDAGSCAEFVLSFVQTVFQSVASECANHG